MLRMMLMISPTMMMTHYNFNILTVLVILVVVDVDVDDVKVPTNVMDTIWKAMRGRSFDALRLAVNDAVAEGYPMSAMLSQLHDDVVFKQGLADLEKSAICEKIAQVYSS